jgi:hypothetical protein
MHGSASRLMTESAAAIRAGLPYDLVGLEEEGRGNREVQGLAGPLLTNDDDASLFTRR